MGTMENLAMYIQQVLELPLVMDRPTPDAVHGGNCFFEAICQQLNNRPELGMTNVLNASQFRAAICHYAIDNMTLPKISDLVENHNKVAASGLFAPWESFFTQMKQSRMFAEGPVVNDSYYAKT